ncbi:MAG: helix-turn-helix domain-containing protein [Deltaproteobacteria bacterium]|nr:helix-turn-helix domain-containing protein [Deltaproteobacteria bacterium]
MTEEKTIHGRAPKVDYATQKKIVDLILSGEKKASEIAREYGTSRQNVSLWVKKFKENPNYHIDVLDPDFFLTDKQKAHIEKLVKAKKPSKYGIEIGVAPDEWTWLELDELIKNEFNVNATRKFCLQLLEDFKIKKAPAASQVSVKKAEPKESPEQSPEESPEESIDDFDKPFDYQAGIKEAQKIMAEKGISYPGVIPKQHGRRTGKHAKGKSAKKSKKRNKR